MSSFPSPSTTEHRTDPSTAQPTPSKVITKDKLPSCMGDRSWAVVATLVGVLVLGIAAFGVAGLLYSHGLVGLPQWLVSMVGTIGVTPYHMSLWTIAVGGALIGGALAIGGIVRLVKPPKDKKLNKDSALSSSSSGTSIPTTNNSTSTSTTTTSSITTSSASTDNVSTPSSTTTSSSTPTASSTTTSSSSSSSVNQAESFTTEEEEKKFVEDLGFQDYFKDIPMDPPFRKNVLPGITNKKFKCTKMNENSCMVTIRLSSGCLMSKSLSTAEAKADLATLLRGLKERGYELIRPDKSKKPLDKSKK